VGLGISGLGVHGLRYMQARIHGGWNRVKIVPDFFAKYRSMVRAGDAPLWPLVLYWVCFPLGILVAFGSIIWIK
jgi:hypothetical protein